jgi:glycosyl-4,4'-diaponeurosporenoate acyltransferase
MILELNHFWLIFLNIITWVIIHLGISYLCLKIPLHKFNNNNWIFKIKNFENDGKIYKKIFKINKWKEKIPDGASIFKGGFPKKRLKEINNNYFNTFMLETCRGEFTHWMQIIPVWVFFLWNPWWSGIIMIVYAFSVNLPCIMLQRYNRARLLKILKDR